MKNERRLLTNLMSFEWFVRPNRYARRHDCRQAVGLAIVADGPARIARQSVAGG